MTKLFSLLEFIAEIPAIERDLAASGPKIVERACQIVQAKAKAAIGREHEEWPALAESTISDKAHQGFKTPAPLLRTGEMRDREGPRSLPQRRHDGKTQNRVRGRVASLIAGGTWRLVSVEILSPASRAAGIGAGVVTVTTPHVPPVWRRTEKNLAIIQKMARSGYPQRQGIRTATQPADRHLRKGIATRVQPIPVHRP
jgi:hypothetical protein